MKSSFQKIVWLAGGQASNSRLIRGFLGYEKNKRKKKKEKKPFELTLFFFLILSFFVYSRIEL